jgi:hypothetical protein
VEYVKLGRKLGMGTRIAAKILRDRTQKTASTARTQTPPVAATQKREPAERAQAIKQPDVRTRTRDATRGVMRGSRGFGQGFWKPFARVFHALWHEITGVFFALFALFFAQNMWRARDAWRSGAEHVHFVIYLIITVLFVYFSISAFMSSRRSSH